MFSVLVQMAGLILCGVVWRRIQPAGLTHQHTRKVLTSLVYYLLLPALVLTVLWQAPLGSTTLLIALSAAAGVLLGLLGAQLTCRLCKQAPAQSGAMILAVAFPNVTYLGLPVLEATFGPWARSLAIQYDLFACTPLLFTVGMLLAARYGQGEPKAFNICSELVRIPALWAAVAATCLNLLAVPFPPLLAGLLELLGRGVVPLMLFSIGLSLAWDAQSLRRLPPLAMVATWRLLLVPLLVLVVATLLGLQGEQRVAVVMEAGMPSMVLGIMVCDRFNLDVDLYASAVTVTTGLSVFTLPLWHQIIL
ncbi:MAG: AEC family transporter [Gammaproteobacteria bacterium]|nr:AEC family transporter [Gammaproteobacteria bacterium]